MNERIKQLARQAGFFYEDYKDIWYLEYHNQTCEEEIKKFAELIVKECLKELRYTVVDTQECRQDKSTDYQVGWEDGMFEAGETIKQHFGVK